MTADGAAHQAALVDSLETEAVSHACDVQVRNLNGLTLREVAFRGQPGGQGWDLVFRVQPPARPRPPPRGQPGALPENQGDASLGAGSALTAPAAEHHPGGAVQQHPARRPGQPADHAALDDEPETLRLDHGFPDALEGELQGLAFPGPETHLGQEVAGFEHPVPGFLGGNPHASLGSLHPDLAGPGGNDENPFRVQSTTTRS